MSKVLVSESNLTAIGSAIREKNGTDTSYKPGDMAAAILEIQTGIEPVGDITITENGEYDVVNYAKAIVDVAGSSGGDIEIPVITGDCSYRFANNGWNWILKQFGNKMRTENITNAYNMFINCGELETIPFEINCKTNTGIDMGYMFARSFNLKSLPKINNCMPNNLAYMFQSLYYIEYFPEDYFDNFDMSKFHNSTSAYTAYQFNGLFNNCYRLRKAPMDFIKRCYNPKSNSYVALVYNSLFSNCFNLDEIVDLPVFQYWTTLELTGNAFGNTADRCYRINRLTFETDNGVPKVAKWKSQTINLTSYVGYTQYVSYLASGITAETRITDDASYQALKNDPNSWTTLTDYSRYNRISAVETINTLPDTSAYLAEKGGTNTIKFKGAAGAKTDGGAINTMTEEEIAVAAAKGWTVSFT